MYTTSRGQLKPYNSFESLIHRENEPDLYNIKLGQYGCTCVDMLTIRDSESQTIVVN